MHFVRQWQKSLRSWAGRLMVTIRLFAPTRRAYDVDNRIKALLDALQHAGCFADDEAIDELQVARGPVQKGGAAKVLILTHTTQNPEQLPL
jgi:crossover junction endodeoxyribonuclease RusA